MRLHLRLALRNLLRNARRTALSLAIIALGTAMTFAVRGYVDDAVLNIRGGIVSQYGNFQIASPVLFDNAAEGYDYLLSPETLRTVEAFLQKHPQVVSYTTQLTFSGLASFGRKTEVLRGIATEPGNQALDYNDLVIEGTGLQPEDQGKVLIGKSLAEERKLKPGDAFRLNASTVDGAYNVGKLEVAGIFSLNNAQAEAQLVFVPLAYAQALLNTANHGKVIVSLKNLEDTERVAGAVQTDLNAAGLGLDVRTWDQLSEFYQQITGFFDALFVFLTLAISVLVFFIVLQVLTMSFLERTREVGTIRALGTKSSQIFAMFLTEGFLLGLAGGVLGIALGWMLSLGFNALEIGWTPPGALDPVPVRITAGIQVAWPPLLVSVVATVLSALFPSTHSARQRIVDALRTN